MTSFSVFNNLQQAVDRHQRGQTVEAESFYRQVLTEEPDNTRALHLLGMLLQEKSQFAAAAELFRQAIQSDPRSASYHNSLGEVCRAQGQLAEAVEAHRQAIALNPQFAEAYNNLALALAGLGRFDEVIEACRAALRLRPDFVEALNNLGNALQYLHRTDEAIEAYRAVMRLRPNLAQVYDNLGMALREQGQTDEAITILLRAIELDDRNGRAWSNLATALHRGGRIDEAIEAYTTAIRLRPDDPNAHYDLGISLYARGRLDEAAVADRAAIRLRPDFAEAYNNLGIVMRDQGRIAEAVRCFRTALMYAPAAASIHSNLLYSLYLHPDCEAQVIRHEHGQWAARHAAPLAGRLRPHENDRSPERRLRIGYVSPDFRRHAAAFFLPPILRGHDRNRFQVVCYSGVGAPDNVTDRLRGLADEWHDTAGISDADLAALIRSHRIDILVDLTLHMAQGRLLTFARKPAPVQVTYLGYPGTTGLKEVDFRLSDPYLDPIDRDRSIYSERTVCLPRCFWCYEPLTEDVPVNALPALQAGHVTFGCLNNFAKVTDSILALWRQVLRAVPRSRLLIQSEPGGHQDILRRLFQADGITPNRIEFVGHQPLDEYFRLYHRLDITLDPFPYNGHTTTCDSLWMGVPVVSLVGERAVSRGGLSLLSNVGLPELAARTPREYVMTAVRLAGNLPRLTQMRAELRQRMRHSPLMDGPEFVRGLESAYRQMWRRWCAAKPAQP